MSEVRNGSLFAGMAQFFLSITRVAIQI